MLREISEDSRATTRGFEMCRRAMRDALMSTYEALLAAGDADLGDEKSLADLEGAIDLQLKAFGALAAFDRGQEERAA